MGQVVGKVSDIFRCNLRAIQTGGSRANTILAADEVWLVDTTNSLTNSLSGNCDAYIVGNGSTAAKALELKKIDSEIYDALGNYTDLYDSSVIDYSALSQIRFYPNASGKWIVYGGYKSIIIPLPAECEYIRVHANNTDAHFFLLKSGTVPTTTNEAADLATGEKGRRSVSIGKTAVIKKPLDCTHIGLGVLSSNIYSATIIESLIQKSITSEVEVCEFIDLKTITISEQDILWTDGKAIPANKLAGSYNTPATSSVLKCSDYVTIPKGKITFTLPNFASATNFGAIFYDANGGSTGIVCDCTGTYGVRQVTFMNKDFVRARFSWFSQSSYGSFYIKATPFQQDDSLSYEGRTFELMVKGYKKSTGLITHDMALSKNDTLLLKWEHDAAYSFSIISRDNSDNNVQYFVNSTKSAATAEIIVTCHSDASKIVIYSNYADNVNYEIYKQVYSPPVNTSLLHAGEAEVGTNRGYAEPIVMKAFYLDNNFKYFSVYEIKRILDTMETAGLNFFLMGFWGSGRGLSFKLDDMTFTADDGRDYNLASSVLTSSGKYLTESDMEEILNYAAGKNIEVCPCINMPGHMDTFLKNYKEFKYSDSETTLNIFSPTAVNFAIGALRLFAKWFSSHDIKYFHCGLDEFVDNQNGYNILYEAGLYEYADFANKVLTEAAAYRLIPLIWNDPICVENSSFPFINRKALVCYWGGLRDNTRGSVEKLENNGYELLNSNRSIYWICGYDNSGVLSAIQNFNVRTYYGPQYSQKTPVGAIFCAWIGSLENPAVDDDGAAITTELLPLISAFGQRLSSQFG